MEVLSGSYQSVEALETANPETGVYVVTENGHIYSWIKDAENAIDLGVYQAIKLSEESVNYNNLSQILKNISNIRIPILNIVKNHYIFRTGIISSELIGWSYTQPFELKKNETIVYFNKGTDNNVAMISVSNSDGTEIDPQVISVNSLEQLYTFTASEDCYIMLSGATALISNVAIYTKLNNQFSDYILNNLIANNALIDFKNNNLITDNLSLNKSSKTSFTINNNSDDIFKKTCDVTINSDGELSYNYNFYFYRKFSVTSDKINKIVAILDIKGQPNENIFFRLAKQKGLLIKNGDNLANINPDTYTRFFIITDDNSDLSNIEELQIGILSTTPKPINTTLNIRLLGFAINVNETYFSNNFLTLLDYKNIFTPNVIQEKPLDNIIHSGGFVNIFNKIACFGDSLTAGQFEANNTGSTSYNNEPDYSYPTQMKRILNNTVLTFGRGGACASNSDISVSESHSWLNIFQNSAFTDDNKCECYILALGTNDIGYYGTFDGNVETDIDTSNYNNNAKNSVGGYATIIQKIKELQPKAKIFCCAIPNTRNSLKTRTEANQKISAICNLFDNCYFMDFQKYGVQPDNVADYKSIYYLGGHMSSQGYYYWALQILSYIDYIIRNNPNDFKQIPFIGTDLSYN